MTSTGRLASPFALSAALHATGIFLLVAFARLQPLPSWPEAVEIAFVTPAAPPGPVAVAPPDERVRPPVAKIETAAEVGPAEPLVQSAPMAEPVEGGGVEGVPSAEAADLETRFLSEFRGAVHRRKFYPSGARRARAQGRVTVDVVLRENGAYESLRVAESSRHEALDEAALQILRRVEGRHPIPEELGRRRWALRIPVEFQLENEE